MYFFIALLYGGPDTLMPIASALAAIIGVLLMLWNRVVSYLRRFVQSSSRRPLTPQTQHPPSIRRRDAGRDRTC
jgi:hypothetical protein